MLQSPRVRASAGILNTLRSNPYLKPEDASAIAKLLNVGQSEAPTKVVAEPVQRGVETVTAADQEPAAEVDQAEGDGEGNASSEVEVPDEALSAYLAEHAPEIAAEKDKPFQSVGGIVELLGSNYFPVSENKEMTEIVATATDAVAASNGPTAAATAPAKPVAQAGPKPGLRDNSVQKINRLDVKGRIQLAMKGNKEERSILIRDGTKVVALAVLDAPKLSDGEVEKFALQKNVLEAVLRQIPLKRRFMKNYIVVRNLVSNPRTPLDLGLGLMKHLQTQDLKNISANKEVSETVRKLALKMYKQKVDAANKK